MDTDDIKWNEGLELGFPLIDNQHKAFYKYIGHLYDECIRGISNQVASVHIQKIYDFALKHFKDEQELMSAYDYPHYKEHLQKHTAIVHELSEFRNKASFNELDSSTIIQFAYALTGWFKNQTLVDDVKLIEFLKNNSKFKSDHGGRKISLASFLNIKRRKNGQQ